MSDGIEIRLSRLEAAQEELTRAVVKLTETSTVIATAIGQLEGLKRDEGRIYDSVTLLHARVDHCETSNAAHGVYVGLISTALAALTSSAIGYFFLNL